MPTPSEPFQYFLGSKGQRFNSMNDKEEQIPFAQSQPDLMNTSGWYCEVPGYIVLTDPCYEIGPFHLVTFCIVGSFLALIFHIL